MGFWRCLHEHLRVIFTVFSKTQKHNRLIGRHVHREKPRFTIAGVSEK